MIESRRERAAVWRVAAAAPWVLLSACGEAGTETDAAVDAAPVVATPSCASPDEAPLRQPDGARLCTREGADPTPDPGDFADAAGAAAPVVYVRPGGNGDGTMASPWGDLATALAATPPPATVMLARGTHALAATADLLRDVTLRGTGPSTVLTGPAGAAALHVAATAGQRVTVTLQRLALRSPTSTAAAGVVSVEGAGATLSLRDVTIDGGGSGLRAEQGATVCARGLTVRGAGVRGVALLAGATGVLRGFVVRDGAGVGVLADRSAMALAEGLVASNGRDGVVVRGALRGRTCATDADCVASAPCEGAALSQRCAADMGASPARRCQVVNTVDAVASLQNRVTGLRVGRTTPTAEEVAAGQREAVLAWAGPSLVATRVVVGATRALDATPGGDGVYVGPGGTLVVDPTVDSDAAQGRASEFVGNARTGVLVDGDRSGAEIPDAARQAGRLSLSGARVASNRGPGLFVQARGVAERVAFAEFNDNAALGLGVTSGGAVSLMICNRFIGTRIGTITPEDPAVRPFAIGDGASLAAGSGGGPRLMVSDCEFSDNRRFGLIFDSYDATLVDGTHGGNRGRNNAFGLGVYGGAALDGNTARTAIQGLTAAQPPTAATARDSVAAGP